MPEKPSVIDPGESLKWESEHPLGSGQQPKKEEPKPHSQKANLDYELKHGAHTQSEPTNLDDLGALHKAIDDHQSEAMGVPKSEVEE